MSLNWWPLSIIEIPGVLIFVVTVGTYCHCISYTYTVIVRRFIAPHLSHYCTPFMVFGVTHTICERPERDAKRFPRLWAKSHLCSIGPCPATPPSLPDHPTCTCVGTFHPWEPMWQYPVTSVVKFLWHVKELHQLIWEWWKWCQLGYL